MAKKLRAGVTGAGWPAWQHIRGYKKSADVELVALCDQNKQKLDKTADQYEIPDRYQSFDEMLEKGGLDIVSICTRIIFTPDGYKGAGEGKACPL